MRGHFTPSRLVLADSLPAAYKLYASADRRYVRTDLAQADHAAGGLLTRLALANSEVVPTAVGGILWIS